MKYPLIASILLFGLPALAADPATQESSDTQSAEQADVDKIKERYWAGGDESELGVVQNRLYSKAGKFELGVFGGVITTDPFLSVTNLGGKVGFHFNEYIGLHLFGYKSFVKGSNALKTFEETLGATTNNNPPKGFLGSELSASVLYGKLSLVGKAIIYFDLHLSGGAGATLTENGNYFTPFGGIGQKIYLAKFLALRVDYRLMRYNEDIIEKVITPRLGELIGTRVNWSNVVTLGVDFLFGLGGE